jgi:hypothetical protein
MDCVVHRDGSFCATFLKDREQGKILAGLRAVKVSRQESKGLQYDYICRKKMT